MSLKNTICLDDRLSQGWDIGYCCEMRAFWHSSESLAPSVPLPEVRPDGVSGALAFCSAFCLAFLTLHQSQSEGEVGLRWLAWFHVLQWSLGIICFDSHIVLQEACLAAKQMVSKWMFLLLVHHIGSGVACFSHPSLFRTYNKNFRREFSQDSQGSQFWAPK